MSSTENKGSAAEQRAATFLQQQKLTLLERNYRCRFGEIDLIMQEGDTLVFVEVRMRSSDRFGGAAASITATKQAKLIRAARHYLAGQDDDLPCRFDAILISGTQGNDIEWIKNAFDEG
ncbi:YraN family protein [Nitrosomonas sp.]|uniref:YraN family protein n=1 Tax=Nitrosomonas sp. TaxID=42353 RepID=UPI0025DFA166|nr:YraN family protein [Nitrosomonas sp.]